MPTSKEKLTLVLLIKYHSDFNFLISNLTIRFRTFWATLDYVIYISWFFKVNQISGKYVNCFCSARHHFFFKLAMLDFFPIYNGSGVKSRAGDLFDLRISLRASSLDSVEESLGWNDRRWPARIPLISKIDRHEYPKPISKCMLSLILP